MRSQIVGKRKFKHGPSVRKMKNANVKHKIRKKTQQIPIFSTIWLPLFEFSYFLFRLLVFELHVYISTVFQLLLKHMAYNAINHK